MPLATGSSSTKTRIASSLVPLARAYIRYGPVGPLKMKVWAWTKWRAKCYVASTCFGARMRGHSLDLVQGYIYYFGVWEPNLTAFLLDRLDGHHGRTFVDVGANVGYFSLLASLRMGRTGSVVSIEAFPTIHEKLLCNLYLNRVENVRTIQAAASDRSSVLELFHAGPLNEGGTTSIPGRFNVPPVRVRAEPLATLLTEREVATLRVMKVDVEGAEWAVLSGLLPAMKYLPDDAEFVVEVNPEAGGKVPYVYDLLVSRGFYPYRLDNAYEADAYLNRLAVTRPQRIDALPAEQTDVVFSRLDRSEL